MTIREGHLRRLPVDRLETLKGRRWIEFKENTPCEHCRPPSQAFPVPSATLHDGVGEHKLLVAGTSASPLDDLSTSCYYFSAILPADQGQGLSAVRGVNLSVRDATQTIPTFYPAFSGASRVVGRLADHRCLLSAVVGVGDRCPDRAACFKLYRSVLRRLGGRCCDRDGFGRAVWASELRGFSPSVKQDRRRLDTRADARLSLSQILARGAGLPAGCRKFSA